jgi:hypothetical protein
MTSNQLRSVRIRSTVDEYFNESSLSREFKLFNASRSGMHYIQQKSNTKYENAQDFSTPYRHHAESRHGCGVWSGELADQIPRSLLRMPEPRLNGTDGSQVVKLAPHVSLLLSFMFLVHEVILRKAREVCSNVERQVYANYWM